MKFFKYKENIEKQITHILLENENEVKLFLKNKNIFWEQDVQNYIKLSLIDDVKTRDRLMSHTIFTTPISSISYKMSNILFDGQHYINPDYYSNMYDKNMLKFINKYGDLFVNYVGGYCNFSSFDKDEYEEVFGFNLENLFLNSKTTYSFNYEYDEEKVLVLENDPILDSWTTKNFKGRVPYILNLRSVMQTQNFEEILNKFSNSYSKKIFVYTTGLDYEQMIDYVNRSINCGFEEFEWVFNGFERIDEFELFLKSKNIKYKYKFI